MDAPPSFVFAKETVTQLITLSTAVIGVSITFVKEFDGIAGLKGNRLLIRSWVVLLASIVCGVWALMSLTGTLARTGVEDSAIYRFNIALPSILQIALFLAGIGLLVRHAVKRMTDQDVSHQSKLDLEREKPQSRQLDELPRGSNAFTTAFVVGFILFLVAQSVTDAIDAWLVFLVAFVLTFVVLTMAVLRSQPKVPPAHKSDEAVSER